MFKLLLFLKLKLISLVLKLCFVDLFSFCSSSVSFSFLIEDIFEFKDKSRSILFAVELRILSLPIGGSKWVRFSELFIFIFVLEN